MALKTRRLSDRPYVDKRRPLSPANCLALSLPNPAPNRLMRKRWTA